MRQVILVLLLLSTPSFSYGWQITVYGPGAERILMETGQPEFRLKGYIMPSAPLQSQEEEAAKASAKVAFRLYGGLYGQAVAAAVHKREKTDYFIEGLSMEFGNPANTEQEMKVQALYEEISPVTEEETGRGIAVLWGLSGNQQGSPAKSLPHSIGITISAEEEAILMTLVEQALKYSGEAPEKQDDLPERADFSTFREKTSLNPGHFFDFWAVRQDLPARFHGKYGYGMPEKEAESIREWSRYVYQTIGSSLEEAEISGLWTVDEPEDRNQETIRYFEFSEPIGGGGGGGGALFRFYKEDNGAVTGDSSWGSFYFGHPQLQMRSRRKSLNYGDSPASVFSIPSQDLESRGFSGSWGGFSLRD